MVLVPEVIKAIKPIRDVPVRAAGGIMTGRQMAACMAMGAAGVWTGSVWLATVESETSEIFREKMIAASSRDAVRSKGRTGKPARQLRSVWTDAWDRGPDSPIWKSLLCLARAFADLADADVAQQLGRPRGGLPVGGPALEVDRGVGQLRRAAGPGSPDCRAP